MGTDPYVVILGICPFFDGPRQYDLAPTASRILRRTHFTLQHCIVAGGAEKKPFVEKDFHLGAAEMRETIIFWHAPSPLIIT